MNPAHPLRIGDVVRIIGPDYYGRKDAIGDIISIHSITGEYLAPRFGCHYPASSLRRVRVVDEDELQIGNQVEIIGPDYRGNIEEIGEKFKIDDINEEYGWYSSLGMNMYPASSLRKLNESPKVEMSTEYKPKCDWCGKYLGKAAINGQDEEQYCSIQCSTMGNDHGRLSAIEKRLALVEAFQKDQIEGAKRMLEDVG